MNLLDIIEKDIPSLCVEDTINDAENVMMDFNIEALPLIDENDNFIALITLEFVENHWPDEKKQTFKDMRDLMYLKKAVLLNTHPYDIARYAINHQLSLIPVIDTKEKYIGIIEKVALFNFIVNPSGLLLEGSIIALKVANIDYILSDIIRICESNDTIVLHVQVSPIPGNYYEIILKTNRIDLSGLKSAFLRYNYQVLYTTGTSYEDDDLDKKYKNLIRFIEM